MTKTSAYVFGFLTVLYAAYSLTRIVTTEAADFSVFYQSARNLILGRNIYRDPTLFTGLGYPPVTLLPVLPLTFVPYVLAQGLWVIGSFLALLGSVFLCLRLVGRRDLKSFLVVSSLAFLSFPTRFTLAMGQGNFYALTFLLLSAVLVKRKQPVWSSVTLVVALLFKPHLTLLLPIFFFTGEAIAAIVTMAILTILTIGVGYVFGWEQFQTYFSDMVPKLIAFRGREIYYNQGIAAFFSRLLPAALAASATLVSSIVVGLVTWWTIWSRRLSWWQAMVVSLPALLLVEPLSWQHHGVFLLPTYVTLWFRKRSNIFAIIVLAVSYIFVGSNLKDPVWWQTIGVGPLVVSHAFVGILGLWILSLTWL